MKIYQPSILIWSLALMALAYKGVEVFFPSIPYLHSYLEDLIFIPLMLVIARTAIRLLHPQWKHYTLRVVDVVVITISVAIYFEWVLPKLSTTHTADAFDVVCYLVGGLIFIVDSRLIKRKSLRMNTP